MGRQVGEGEMRSLCEYMLVLKMTTKLSFCSRVVDMPIARKKHELLYVAGVIRRLTVKCLRLVDLSVTNNGTTCGLTPCNVDD